MPDEVAKTEIAPSAEIKPAEPVTVRRVIDLGDGAGQEIFEASGATKEEALEALADKIADGKRHASKKIRQQEAELRKNDTIAGFVAGHDDYENEGDIGRKNGELMRMRLAEQGLSVTEGNLHAAYSHLKQKGLLKLKGDEPERVTPSAPAPTPQRTRKVTSIGTQHRTQVQPASAGPSEYEAYKMPLEDLKHLANRQLSERTN